MIKAGEKKLDDDDDGKSYHLTTWLCGSSYSCWPRALLPLPPLPFPPKQNRPSYHLTTTNRMGSD
jgi:hypothetical protein